MPLVALFAACSMTVGAQDAKEPRKSPHETITVTLEGKPITISYGRPYLKGRKAVGGTLVPYGQVWRLGADEATKLTTPVNLGYWRTSGSRGQLRPVHDRDERRLDAAYQ